MVLSNLKSSPFAKHTLTPYEIVFHASASFSILWPSNCPTGPIKNKSLVTYPLFLLQVQEAYEQEYTLTLAWLPGEFSTGKDSDERTPASPREGCFLVLLTSSYMAELEGIRPNWEESQDQQSHRWSDSRPPAPRSRRHRVGTAVPRCWTRPVPVLISAMFSCTVKITIARRLHSLVPAALAARWHTWSSDQESLLNSSRNCRICC